MAVEFKSSTEEEFCPKAKLLATTHELLPLMYPLVVYATKMVNTIAVRQEHGEKKKKEARINLGGLILQDPKAIENRLSLSVMVLLQDQFRTTN